MTYKERAFPVQEALPSIRIDVAFSLILLGSTLLWSIIDGWLMYFYLPPAGQGISLVPVALYGTAIFAARALNAVLTPAIGYWSDHTQNRWGRRLPFMFGASLPLLIFFTLLWIPPIRGESMINLVYLGVVLAFYQLTQSLVLLPCGALLPELARSDKHRLRMTAWSSSFQMVGIVLAGLAGMLIQRSGYSTTALIYAVVAFPLLYAPFLVLRERPGLHIDAAKRFGFWQSLSITLRNRAFLVLTGAGICFWAASTFILLVIPFIVTEICRLTISDTPYFYLPAVLASLACYPAVTWLSNRFGKWRVFCGSLLASAVVLPGLMLIGDWIPLPLSIQGVTWITLQAVALSGVIMLPRAFAAEITDYDESLTGQRREGAYFSAWSFLDQVINGIAGAILPLLLLLGRSRSDPFGPLGVRMVGPIGGVLLLIAFLIFLRYPLRENSVSLKQGVKRED